MSTDVFKYILTYLRNTPVVTMFFHALIISLVSLILTTCYLIIFHFNNVLNIYQEAHDISNFGDSIQGNMKNDENVDKLMSATLVTLNANRAYIYRYHNGLAAINGIPFYFESMMQENIKPGMNRLISFEQRLPASITPIVNTQFIQNKCYYSNTLDKIDHPLNFMFQSRGSKSIVRCPIFLVNGNLWGFLGVEWNEAIEINDNIKTQIKSLTEQVSALYASLKKN